ncbi:uncharacterized protein CLUP02_13484 [Colletotrichum lupini]|uniref:Uncharacterized protein n=1 Tax=Colletotrichum lupini TaxID=145971 RepID=A0A9Q8T2Z4_9PEZI|nr:uncharacterized protein CLUP02_13484 [Colletotrichum lupini]UQC87963.1 hypothetical protein CLUP02_13484 [Colletotrichum lupini]
MQVCRLNVNLVNHPQRWAAVSSHLAEVTGGSHDCPLPWKKVSLFLAVTHRQRGCPALNVFLPPVTPAFLTVSIHSQFSPYTTAQNGAETETEGFAHQPTGHLCSHSHSHSLTHSLANSPHPDEAFGSSVSSNPTLVLLFLLRFNLNPSGKLQSSPLKHHLLDTKPVNRSHLVPSIFRRHPINQLQSQYKVATPSLLDLSSLMHRIMSRCLQKTSNPGGLFKLSTSASEQSCLVSTPESPFTKRLFVPTLGGVPRFAVDKNSLLALVSLVLSPKLDNLQAALRGQGAAPEAAGRGSASVEHQIVRLNLNFPGRANTITHYTYIIGVVVLQSPTGARGSVDVASDAAYCCRSPFTVAFRSEIRSIEQQLSSHCLISPNHSDVGVLLRPDELSELTSPCNRLSTIKAEQGGRFKGSSGAQRNPPPISIRNRPSCSRTRACVAWAKGKMDTLHFKEVEDGMAQGDKGGRAG